MSVGFIGVGDISSAVITGLLTAENAPDRVVVSPRSAEKVAALVKRFSQVHIARDNQEVIDSCDTICLAIRPQVAKDVLSDLQFREDLTVVSFVATFSASDLTDIIGPVKKIVRMVPLPPVAKHMGPVVISPADPEVEELFKGIGTLVKAKDDHQLHALWSVTAMMAPYFGLLGSVSGWLREQGLPAEEADAYAGSMFHAVSDAGLAVKGEGFDKITVDHATAGGLNEQLLRELTNKGVYDNVAKGLSLILARLNGQADFGSTIE